MIIFVVAILAVVFYLTFYVTVFSIKKLKVSTFASYPFDLFFPSERSWSAGFFIVIILALGLLIYLIAKGGFYAVGPA